MNTAKNGRFLAVLVAFLVAASVVPGALPYVRAQESQVSVYDNNDNVFFIGETIYIEFTAPVDVDTVAFNTSSSQWALYPADGTSPDGEVVEHTYDPSTGHYYKIKVKLDEGAQDLVGESGLRVKVELQNGDVLWSPVIYINKLTLDSVISVKTGETVDGGVADGQWQSGNGYLLIGDAINITFTIDTATFSEALLEYLKTAKLYFGEKKLVIYNESTTIKAKVVEYPITKYQENLNVTNADNEGIFAWDDEGSSITQGFQLNAGVVLVDQKPYNPGTDGNSEYNEAVTVATAGSNFDFDAYVYWAKETDEGWELHEFSLPYNITIKLPSGLEFVEDPDSDNDNTTWQVGIVTDYEEQPIPLSGVQVQIPENYAQGIAKLTVIEHKTGESWEWPLVYVLESGVRGYVNVDKEEYYIGVDTVQITYAITDVEASNEYYQLVLMDEDENVLYNITDDPQPIHEEEYGVSQSHEWHLTIGGETWPLNVPPGTYYIGLIIYNGTEGGPDAVNFTAKTDPIDFIWNMTIAEFSSVYNKYHDFEGPIYPGDDIFVNFTSTHDGATGFWLVIFNDTNYSSIYNWERGEEEPPENIVWSGWINEIPNYNESTHTGYAAVNLSSIQDDGFDITKLKPGTYYLVIYDELSWTLGMENVTIFPVEEFTVEPHVVTPTPESASIPIGTSYKIQVTTTSDGALDIDVGDSGIAYEEPVQDKPFNATTHIAVWNVTFTTSGDTELGEWPINITVENGNVSVFTLTVTDDMTVLYAPTKVVLGSTAFIMLNTTANLSERDYTITVWAFGVEPTSVGPTVELGDYNDTTMSRIVNMTFGVTEDIYSKDPENYPIHYMNITDGHVWVEKTFEIVEDPELYLEPVGTVVLGQNVEFKGTTLLGPGSTVNVEIVQVDPQNVSQNISAPISMTAGVKLGDEKNVFEFEHQFTEPGLYNVTVSWGEYDTTIQVNVTSEGVLSISTDRDEYYPDGFMKVTGQLDDVTEANAIELDFYWLGGSASATVDLVNGTFEYYFDLSQVDNPGDLLIKATYHGYANASKTVTIVEEPVIENLVVPEEPIQAGELFNITADTNLGVNGTVALTIVKADNASDVKVDEAVKVGEGGAFLYTVNTTNWTAGCYNVTLSKGDVNATAQVYVYVVGSNISVKNATFAVPEDKVVNFTVPVNVTLENTGDLDGDYTVEVYLDESVAATQDVTVKAGEEKSVIINVEVTEPGEHIIKVAGFNTTFTALAPANISITNLTIDPSGEMVFNESFNMTINVTLENAGDVAGDYTVVVTVNDEELTKNVTVEPGTMVVTFEYEITGPGLYVVKAGDFERTLNVTEKPKSGMATYKDRVQSAENVYITFKNYQSMDYAVSVPYVTPTLEGVSPKFRFAENFVSQLDSLTASDVVIAIGGPLANNVTAYYEDMAYVHMNLSNLPDNITIVTPNEEFVWTLPTTWWNVSEGYFIIQLFEDPDTGALVVTIYGTDMDSTAAGAYYFAHVVYPNLEDYDGVHYMVGLWEDTEHGADYELPAADQGDDSGFSSGDSITIVAQG